MGSGASGYQEVVDQLDGIGKQRVLLPVDGFVLLPDRPQRMVAADDVVARLWHEFHRGLYAGDVRQLPEYRAVGLLWVGTVYGEFLWRVDRNLQCVGHLHYLVDDV